ncbi:MAG: S1C family serine protease, partial [Clostridiales bacterium]|nr:S1C family serine protease [Clostridiales bacterium]
IYRKWEYRYIDYPVSRYRPMFYPTTDAPATTEPTTEEPTTEEPTTEASIAAETTTEEPTTETTTEEPSTEEPVAESVTLTATEIYKIAAAYTVEVSVTGNGFTATGSGFFISTDGQVVTNYHVIDDATEITVTDYSGNTYTVTQILAYDEDMDIAVLKVDAETTAAVLNKGLPETGDTIYTLGSSKSLTDTFSDGIVSNPARVIEEVNPDMEYIQITAPISNGNSGGPLINNKGEVIGINSMGYTSGQNINFAIPVKYLDELDYSNPLTIDEFVQLSIPDGCIVASTYSVNLKPGGSGCIQIQLVDLPSDSTVVFQSSTNAINCEWSDWYYNNSTKLTDTTFLYISAIDTVSDGYILIYIKDYPTIQIKITVNISAYGSSLYAFGDTACPDFGAYTGVAPTSILLSDNAEIISFAYQATDLSAAGNDATTDFVGYTTYLDSYGFTLYKTESESQNGYYYDQYYYLNKSTGESILLRKYYTNSQKSVISRIAIAIG